MTTDSVIGASIGVLVGACFGFFCHRLTKNLSTQITRDEDNKDLTNQLESYNQMVREVDLERGTILDTLEQMMDLHSAKTGSDTHCSVVPDKFRREREDIKIFVTRFSGLLKDYPRYSAEEAKADRDYLPRIHQQTLQHHEAVKTLAEECFRRIEPADKNQHKPAVRSL
ncbi:hypothetical protein Lmor_2378 [Legionella moravica]|uniref:Transmembrane protein n=1 Tax=Legionella moravica TaxID=39962 RepID=A0A378JVR3_9GAMM|nr:hypothetical protein [Legionella moravica]KTD32440.1 hypothetical protein Lmor_2378 [Legionella moravica]STX62536.1 Uncharacterised protein [Legionella moravica]